MDPTDVSRRVDLPGHRRGHHGRGDPDGVERVTPSDAVVSLVRPLHRTDEVRKAICDQGHFFGDRQAAAPWLARHPDGQVHSVAEDFRLHRTLAERLGWSQQQGRVGS
jgi:Alkylmercury lyase